MLPAKVMTRAYTDSVGKQSRIDELNSLQTNVIRKIQRGLGAGTLALCVAIGGASSEAADWNPKAAAAYLDRRAEWWITWPAAARDQGTFCISCHTALPYALSRPALRAALDEKAPSASEQKLLNSITKRVRSWQEVKPFYGDRDGFNKGLQSRGTESVLNALILANLDARTGNLSGDTRTAFRNLWALQETAGDEKGAWPWLDFGNEPFEAKDSQFYGACLAAIAVGTAPENLRAASEAEDKITPLREYLRREYADQSLINQVALLWASARLPGLLTSGEQASITEAVLRKQQADGGWSLSSLVWSLKGATLKSLVKLWIRSENSPLQAKSDGYATGLTVFALEQVGFSVSDIRLQRGLAWLKTNQNPTDGRWPGYSLNHRRDPSSATGLFMSDAATAYAVLAAVGADWR